MICQTHKIYHGDEDVCPKCWESRRCRCGTFFYAKADDFQVVCPMCSPVQKLVDGKGVSTIVLKTTGINNNVYVEVKT